MGLFDAIFSNNKKNNEVIASGEKWQALTPYSTIFRSFSGDLYDIGLIRSAVDARARHISKLQIVFEGSAKAKLKNAIKNRPNPYQTWSQFLYRLSTLRDMQRSAYIVPAFDEMGEVTSIYSILADDCELIEYHGRVYIRYKFANGKVAAIELDKVGIMSRFQYKDDIFGTNNDALKPDADLLSLNQQGIKAAIKNGAQYRFMAKVSNFTKSNGLKEERKRFTDDNFKTDIDNNGILLFPNTYSDIKQVNNTPFTVDKDQNEYTKTEIYNYFGVSEEIIQNKATPDVFAAFYEGVVETFAIQFSEVLTAMFYTSIEITNGNKIMATSNRLQFMSNADKLQVSAQMADRGLMTINEIREIWNLPAVEGGDVFIRRGEYYADDGSAEEINNTSEEGETNAE